MLNLGKLSTNFFLYQTKDNPDKCQLFLSTSEKVIMNIHNLNIINGKSEKLLGITKDINERFQSHVNNLCQKASSKIHAQIRIAP